MFVCLDRSGKSLSKSSNQYSDFSPVVSTILENPSLQTGTFYYYQTDGLTADTSLVNSPQEDVTDTTMKNDEGQTTTVRNDETTKENDENVGEETEPTIKNDEESAESVLNESLVNSSESKEDKDTSSTSTTTEFQAVMPRLAIIVAEEMSSAATTTSSTTESLVSAATEENSTTTSSNDLQKDTNDVSTATTLSSR